MSASTLLRSTLLIAVLLGSAYLFHVPNTYAAACAKYASGSTIPAGYGASYDLWNLTSGSLLNTDCTTSAFSIQVGNGETTTANFAVYKTGYRWTGSTWQAITFVPDGGEYSGNYILGKAKSESALSYAGTDTYFVAFTCSKRDGAWKCGCRDTGCAQSHWQLQAAVKGGSTLNPSGDGSNSGNNTITTGGSGTATGPSPVSQAKGLPLLYSYDAAWRDLIARGQTNPTVYHPNTGYNDPRNKCTSQGCTRTLANFGGRATMKFTQYAGVRYDAGAPDGGQVSQTSTIFVRQSGKSYTELIHTWDVYVPSSANAHIPDSLLSTQTNSDRTWDRCQIGMKGPTGLISGQVNPFPASTGRDSDGWQYVLTPRNGAATYFNPRFGNRECSGSLNQYKADGIGGWPYDGPTYATGISCQKGNTPIVPRDRWVTLEMYGKLDTNGSNGVVEVYLDGTLACGNYNFNWGGSKGYRFIGFGGLFMWGGYGNHMVARDTSSFYYSNERVFGR